ncbi:MAG: hypothetical protein WCB49_13760 [Gammaproteobacteria bacterium]
MKKIVIAAMAAFALGLGIPLAHAANMQTAGPQTGTGYFGVYTGWPDAIGAQYTLTGTFGSGSYLRFGIGIPAFYQAFGVDLSGDALFDTVRFEDQGKMRLGGGLSIGFLNTDNQFTHNSNIFAYPHFLVNFSMMFNSHLQGFVEPEIGPLFVSRGYGTTGRVAVKVGLNFTP